MAQEALPPLSKEVITKVREDLNLDEKRLSEALQGIKDWMELQPHLPQDIDDDRLERWLIRCKNSMEKTKKTLDLYYSLRTVAPELMCGWDVNEPWFDHACKCYYLIPMPELTENLDRVIVTGFLDDHKDFEFLSNLKVILLISEIRMRDDYNVKDVYVVDMGNYTLSDCQKMHLPLLKKIEVCIMRGFNTRLRAVHFLNTPPYAHFIVMFLKSIFKSKLVGRIYVHGSDLTEFYKQVPKECLPVEYGGNRGKLIDYWKPWQKKLKSNRDYLLSREKLRADETKRPPGNVSNDELFGFEGSFRTLSID